MADKTTAADQLGLTEADREKLAELIDKDARSFNTTSGTDGPVSMRVSKTCDHCQSSFDVPPSQSDQQYCSRDCSNNAGAVGRPSERVSNTCDHCQSSFDVPPSKSDQQYCSRDCSNNAASMRVSKTCDHCETSFDVPPSRSDRRFCSSACSHSAGKGGRPVVQTDGGLNTGGTGQEPEDQTPDQSSTRTDSLKHWQQCEIPECFNEVPKSKAICDCHAGGGRGGR